MKKIIINQGVTERYDNLFADEIVVNGLLIVNGIIRVKKIYGGGIVQAKRINARSIVIDTLEAEHVCVKKLIANKIFCQTATVSIGIIAKDYIEADTVKTSRLTATLSRITTTEASEIIRLLPKRNFFTAVFCSWVKERFHILRHSYVVKQDSTAAKPNPASRNPMDMELEQLVNGIREKYRTGGYRLVLEAVEPETRKAA